MSLLTLFLMGILVSTTSSVNANDGRDTKNVDQIINQNDNSTKYSGVIRNGHYIVSKSRGLTAENNGNINNVKGFENGLLDVSKKKFPTNKYVFQEGQYLDSRTVQHWLDRKSASNPYGLNPEPTTGTGKHKKRNPIYLQSLEEQDFMEQYGTNSLTMSGMTIGLAMNSVDYYHKQQFGPEYQTKVSYSQLVKKSKTMAQSILNRVRRHPSLRHIPILIAVYRQASNDSLGGGSFIQYASTNNNSVGDWHSLHDKTVMFPSPRTDRLPSRTDQKDFNDFKNQIQNFFPNLSSTTATAQYERNVIKSMQINITTQFYSQTEIDSFTQFVADQAQNTLPANIPINIQISSTEGTDSLITRDVDDQTFQTHVLDNN